MAEFLFSMMQKAINYYLSLDPLSAKQFTKIQNKWVKIELLGLGLTLYLHFSAKGIEIFNASAAMIDHPDTIIKGTPFSLLRMSLTHTNRKKFFSDDIKIEGDLELAQAVIEIFDQLEIDWEEILAKKIGDVPAHQIGKIARYFKNWCQSTHESLRRDTVDYLHEEKLWFPPEDLLQEFFAEVDALRLDVERLEARIKRYL